MDTSPSLSLGVSQAVQRALTAAGISALAASQNTGIPRTTLHRRLTGSSPFLVTELVALAELCGVQVSALVASAEERLGDAGGKVTDAGDIPGEPGDMTDRLAYTRQEAADSCGLSYSIIDRAIKSGALRERWPGKGKSIILRADLEAWLDDMPENKPT